MFKAQVSVNTLNIFYRHLNYHPFVPFCLPFLDNSYYEREFIRNVFLIVCAPCRNEISLEHNNYKTELCLC